MNTRLPALPERLVLPARTVCRPGSHVDLFKEWGGGDARCLIVHGRALDERRLAALIDRAPSGTAVKTWRHVGGEPTMDDVGQCLSEARRFRPDWIAAVGGGSVIDIAKACAGLIHADHPVESYHDGAPLPGRSVPYVAVPTTAGTGTEATMVTVLTNARTGVKKSFRDPSMAARLVILDPTLLASCPPQTMAASGMDALVQAIESFFSRGATAFTDHLALDAARLINDALVAGVRNPADPSAASELMQGSFLAGCALSNARLGLVHGLAHPLGVRFHAAHGLVCGVCMPAVLRFNREAVGEKYDRLAKGMGCDPAARIEVLLRKLDLRSPFPGQKLQEVDALIDETMASGSTAANPRPVTRADVTAIISELFRPGA